MPPIFCDSSVRRFATGPVCLVLGLLLLTGGQVGAADGAPAAERVQPIDWSRFDTTLRPKRGTPWHGLTRILLTNVKYQYDWIDRFYRWDSKNKRYQPGGVNERRIRPGASAAYGIAVVLETGLAESMDSATKPKALVRRNRRLIDGLAAAHTANTDRQKAWGDQWQSALWAGLLGQSAWLMWDRLDAETRQFVAAMVVHEANRFLDYEVPYWNGEGGDTKAEENAWNAIILRLAVAMMPDHPRAKRWRQKASELMISAFAIRADLQSRRRIGGRPLAAWLDGYNVREDGFLVNHNLIHPDYMSTVTMSSRALLTQSLAGQTVPESARFNFKLIYRALTKHEFESPPHEPPGGTVYVPGQARVYYPEGTDWSPHRIDIFLLLDLFAKRLGIDKQLNIEQAVNTWIEKRINAIRQMQRRFDDGRTYAAGEFDTYQGSEQLLAYQLGDAVLLRWLAAQDKLSPLGNWHKK